jgi:diadenosine tetraphosphate (Ap4A) HIT family hydrolase
LQPLERSAVSVKELVSEKKDKITALNLIAPLHIHVMPKRRLLPPSDDSNGYNFLSARPRERQIRRVYRRPTVPTLGEALT